jgi:adenine-specific DNA-methyltransferase
MTREKQKLELTWIGKENRPRLEPRILVEDPEKSYHAPHRVTDKDIFDNRLIFGDNLLALKALEQEFGETIKCIYIDPPFNTQQAFEHYDDGVEHSIWLSLMRDRIEILYSLLSVDGTFFVHIDDNELGYLIALTDEIFGRKNRAYIVTFKQSSVSGPKAINPGLVTTSSFILVYAKNKSYWKPEKVIVPTKRDERYSKYIVNIESKYSDWRLISLRQALAETEGITARGLSTKYTKESLEDRLEEFVLSAPDRVVRTARVAPKDIAESCRIQLKASQDKPETVFKAERDGKLDMYFLNGEQLIFYSSKTKIIDGRQITGAAGSTIWDDILSNNLHNEGQVTFPNGKKPEALIKRLIEMATKKGDYVLDSFAGSGTTGAVAHKMGRRWIMVELGEHCDTHIVPRLKKLINGEDSSGITNSVNWKGGGGFRYYRLAPSLLEKDKWGNWVINKEYNAAMLAEALCKLEGFVYAPSDSLYWQQGHSTERDFIYVTTQNLSHDQLQALNDEVGQSRSLLVLCAAFRGKSDRYPNLTVKKIPNAVLKRCEWGHDDYSLRVENLPKAPPKPGQLELFGEEES